MTATPTNTPRSRWRVALHELRRDSLAYLFLIGILESIRPTIVPWLSWTYPTVLAVQATTILLAGFLARRIYKAYRAQ